MESRRKASLFIAAVVLSQGLLPLHYYLGLSHPNDERFAWRMFSETRQLQCQVRFQEDHQDIALKAELHSAWITLLKRGRPSVVSAVERRLCLTHPGELTLYYSCRQLDGQRPVYNDGKTPLCVRE